MSQITTHILDTSLGKPAENVLVILERPVNLESWQELGRGHTDKDGRIKELLGKDIILEPGVYRIKFDTGNYFNSKKIKAFYPSVTIEFLVFDEAHYHVPLLLNPFGYATYRGS